jgi:transcriptional regulator with XRE-family HTH domain
MNELKLKLKYWRLRRAFNIKQLAKESGVSTSTIVKIEKTGYVPRGDVIKRLATSLNVPLDDMWEDVTPKRAATGVAA